MDTSQGYTMSLLNRLDVNYIPEIREAFELATKHGFLAHFLELTREGPIHNAIFRFQLVVGDFSGEGEGPTKVIAKTMAAQQVLVALRKLPLPEKNRKTKKGKKKNLNGPGLWQAAPVFKPDQNPVCCLNDLVIHMRGKTPKYTLIDLDKTSEIWVFHIELSVADETVLAKGNSKMEAKRNAAAMMLSKFGYNFPYVEPEQYTLNATPNGTQDDASPVTQDNAIADTKENTTQLDTPQNQEEVQPLSVDLQLLPEEVLPLLASMAVTEENNGMIQLSKPEPSKTYQPDQEVTQKDVPQKLVEIQVPSVGLVQDENTQEEALPVTLEFSPEVTQDESLKVTLDKIFPVTEKTTPSVTQGETPEITLDRSSAVTEETIPSVTQGETPKITLDRSSAVTEETIPSVTQGETPKITLDYQVTQGDAYQNEEEVQPSVDLQTLPLEIRSLLVSMEIIEDNNGIVQWYEPRPSDNFQEEVSGSENQMETTLSEEITGPKTTKTISPLKTTLVTEMARVEPPTSSVGSNTTDQGETPDTTTGSEISSSPVFHFGASLFCTLTHATSTLLHFFFGLRRAFCNTS